MVLEKGTYKVVWITKNTKRIYSKMFEDLDQAKKFGEKKKDFLMFRLLKNKNFKEYSWNLLPYGNYKLYETALKLYQKHKGKKFFIESLLKSF